MSRADNTLLLRLAGPMQSWGTSSRLQVRRTDPYPSKSGVLGMILCAKGVRREDSAAKLEGLSQLAMGVRVDRAGTLGWDYHTAGAKIGIWQADRKKLKRTASTGEYETLLSRRQYLYDASFLVALQSDEDEVNACARALDDPVWPVFLGRKCCVPSEPILVGTGFYDTMIDALSSVPWRPRMDAVHGNDRSRSKTLNTFVEHLPGTPPPEGARLVHDVPRVFGFHNHGSRWVVAGTVSVPVEQVMHVFKPQTGRRPVDYTSAQWKAARSSRLSLDSNLCVFCKSPAVQVHHVDYANVGSETDADLRSLCKDCHDACTMLEYGRNMRTQRIDPSDPELRLDILRQLDRLHRERRRGRRRELLESGRTLDMGLLHDVMDSSAKEGF